MCMHHHVDIRASASDDKQFSSIYPSSNLQCHNISYELSICLLWRCCHFEIKFNIIHLIITGLWSRNYYRQFVIGYWRKQIQFECVRTNKRNRTTDKVTSSCQVAGSEDNHIAPCRSLFLWNTCHQEKNELDDQVTVATTTRMGWKGWSTCRSFSLEITHNQQFHLQCINSFTVLTEIVIKMHFSIKNYGYLDWEAKY